MNRSTSNPELAVGLRISPKPVIVVLWALGLVFFLVGDLLQPGLLDRSKVLNLALLSYALGATCWMLDSRNPGIGRWFTIVALIILLNLGNSWLGIPGFPILMVIPTALAAALIDLPAATISAVGETALLLLSLQPAATSANLVVVTAMVAIWAMLGVVYASHRRMRHLCEWLQHHLDQAQLLMEEVRHHRAESAQTLDSLAYANRQLALANERTADLRAIAEEALKTKTSFMANVSHEFRTPLNMIIGLVELMIDTPEIYDVLPSPKMREDLRVVHRNCEHVSKMINDILDLTRIEAGYQAIHREWADLQEIVEDSIMAIRALLETKRLAVKVSLSNNLPKVYCDRTRIQQVILNLLSNAARFTEEGGITIEVERYDQHVLVNVKDTGPGISPEDARRIFEPFCQGSSELWRDKGGSGLGLSISEQFVRLHGGRMWVESELGVGTSFSFTLPVSPPIEHIVRPGHYVKEDWEWRKRAFRTDEVTRADELYKPRVVVCDETGDLYAAFSRYSSEVEFVDARDLEQVIEELQHCPAHAVVINTAIFDGQWTAVNALGRKVPDTPIVGCSVPRSIERAIAAGALGYLVKPVTQADLQEAIQAVGRPVGRVLVVDDDLDALHLFSRMLRVCRDTLEIVTASSGRQALDELRREVPDLVLLDILMPDMDGWQILQLMNQDEKTQHIPTFFLSAQDPADQPPVSEFLLATMGQGLSLGTLLRCSLEISSLLLKPSAAPDPVPV